jgi:hypothetical protein
VNPTRSQNSDVTTRRSSRGASTLVVEAGPVVRPSPQFAQKREPSADAAPQRGQATMLAA